MIGPVQKRRRVLDKTVTLDKTLLGSGMKKTLEFYHIFVVGTLKNIKGPEVTYNYLDIWKIR